MPAGKYAIFTIPGKEKWNIIVNKNWDQTLRMNILKRNRILQTILPDDDGPDA